MDKFQNSYFANFSLLKAIIAFFGQIFVTSVYIYRYTKYAYTIPNLTKNLFTSVDKMSAYKVQISKIVYSNGQILKFVLSF